MEAYLRAVLRTIAPTPTQTRGAQRSHLHLRELLDSGQMASRLTGSYLSGSYSRDTAIYPLDDVDIIFTIDPAPWQIGLFGKLMRPSPEKVLQSFARALRLRYPQTSVDTQRRSVRLALAHVDIDCVPAIEEGPASPFIFVPDRKDGTWIRSSPVRHKLVSTEVNAANNGLLKPLIKLLKHWNAFLPETARVRSFLIETLTTTLFSHQHIETLTTGLVLFFDFLAHWTGQARVADWKNSFGISLSAWATEVPDIAGTGANVAAGMSAERRMKFLQRAVVAREHMLKAVNASTSAAAQRHLAAALKIDT